MRKPRICATIVDYDIEAIKRVAHLVDLYEVRLDLVGPGWVDLVKMLNRPWIACNRSPEEGGKGDPDEVKRLEELIWAVGSGACIVDIEYRSKNLKDAIALIRPRAGCLISYHDLAGTPSYETLMGIINGQLNAGADICKVVTTALEFEDNLKLLKLINEFAGKKIIAFAMGDSGRLSRILCPLAGGYLTYVCLKRGKESAEGQLTVLEMNEIYSCLKR